MCPTLCGPTDCSPPGSSVRGILQTRILERVAMPSSRGSAQPRDWIQVSSISCTSWHSLQHEHYQREPMIFKAAAGWLRTAGWKGPRTDPCHQPAMEDAAEEPNALARPRPSALEWLPAPRRDPGMRGEAEERERTRWGASEETGSPRDSPQGRCSKADLDFMDCKTVTMKVIREIFTNYSYSVVSEWIPCKTLFLWSLEIIKWTINLTTNWSLHISQRPMITIGYLGNTFANLCVIKKKKKKISIT